MTNEHIATRFLQKLAAASQIEESQLQLLSLERTSQLRAAFLGRLPKPRKRLVTTCPPEMRRVIQECWRSSWRGSRPDKVVLLHAYEQQVGAVLTPSSILDSDLLKIWELVREDIIIISEDLSQVQVAEVVFFDSDGLSASTGLFEIWFWDQALLDPKIDDSLFKLMHTLGIVPDLGPGTEGRGPEKGTGTGQERMPFA